MADVYRIQAVINLGGNLAPELQKILRSMDRVEKEAKGVEKATSRWASSIDRATASVGRFARAMGDARKHAHGVDREVGRMRGALGGLRTPTAGIDRDLAKWATALGRPLAEMRSMRRETQGVASAARGVSRSIDSWAGKVGKAASAMARLQKAASNTHLPNIPQSVGGGTVGGRNPSRRHASHRRRGHQFGQHEGSHVAGAMGVYGGMNTIEYLVDQGAGGAREDLRARNAGLTVDERLKLRERANDLSRQYPSLSQLGIREQGRLLIPNVGDYSKAMEVLPEYLKGQVALQTTSGPEGGAKDMEHMARFIDLIGRSTSVPDTNRLIDGFVRARQLDPEAVKGNDYVNAAQSAGTAGKALSTEFWSTVMPAYFMQQGGARTGTDLASAFQNTVIGRGTDESLIKQSDEGYREGLEWKYDKNGKRKLIKKGNYVDEGLRSSNPYEWTKKHAVPRMIAQGMLPEGYARGDFSQSLTDEQRVRSAKYLAERFSNRRGANFESIAVQEMAQMEAIMGRLRNASGTSSVSSDQKTDPYIAGAAIKTQAGNAASALAAPAIADIVAQANKIAAALGSAADTLSKHPVAAGTAFGVGAAAVGGAAAAGITALTLAAVGTLSLPALAIGAGTAVTIAAVTIPWDAIKQSVFGVAPATKGVGRDAHLESMRRTAALNKVVGPRDFTLGLPGTTPGYAKVMPNLPAAPEMSWWDTIRNYGRGGLKRPPQAPSMFNTVPGLPDGASWKSSTEAGGAAPAAIKQAGDAIGQAGTSAASAAPNIKSAGDAASAAGGGFNTAADGANKAAGAAGAAGGALAGLAAKISAMGSFGIPGAKAVGAPPAAGAGGAGAGAGAPAPTATPGKTSAVYRGGGQTVQVASTLNMDGRAVGRAVTRHQVASLDTRAGTARFVGSGAKTPVGQPMPVIG